MYTALFNNDGLYYVFTILSCFEFVITQKICTKPTDTE